MDRLHQKARHKLRVTMKDKGHTAPSLARACGLSRSLIEKLMSAESRTPSLHAVEKIEDALQIRIWSSPSEFKRRRATFQKLNAAPPTQEQTDRESLSVDPVADTEAAMQTIGIDFRPSEFRRLPLSRLHQAQRK